MKTYLIFHIVGFTKQDPVGNLEDKVVIRLIDTSYESALKRLHLNKIRLFLLYIQISKIWALYTYKTAKYYPLQLIQV